MPKLRTSAAYHIAVSYAAIFAWTIICLGATMHLAVSAEFRHQRDAEITAEIDRLAHETNQAELLRQLRSRQSESSSGKFVYSLFDNQGRRLQGKLELPDQLDGFSDLQLQNEDSKTQLRAGISELVNGSLLVVAINSQTMSRVNTMILQFLVGALIALFGISVLSGVVLAWYLRRRLEPINTTANAIVAGELKWRVPTSDRRDEFDVTGDAVNHMLDRIAGLMDNLRQVSSDIAHDLRKPLMRMLVQADRMGKAEGAEQRVLELGDELLMLFTGILRIAEVEGGDLTRTFSKIDFSALMIDVAEIFAPALADNEHVFEWDIQPGLAVLGNRELLAQLVSNLLDNARIHTPPRTTIKMMVAAEGGQVNLTVEDDGPGVCDDDREKLQQRFFRAELSRSKPGNGLGLSLVASTARAHGGVLAIEDANPGLRILVRLPKLSR